MAEAGATTDDTTGAARQIVLVVIAPDDFWYSGLATGVLGGPYPTAREHREHTGSP